MNAIFKRALSKNPADRYQSCAEFVAALQDAASIEVRNPAIAPTLAAAALPNRSGVDPGAPTMLRKGQGGTASAATRSRLRSAVVPAVLVAVLAIAAGSLGTYLLTRADSDMGTAPVASSPVPSPLTDVTTTRPVPPTSPPLLTTPATVTTTVPTATDTSTAAPTGPNVGPNAARVSYTVEADTPTVQIAYTPGQWQDYTPEYSNLAGRYAMSLQAFPERAENMFIAVRGSTSQHCRIRVSGEVVAVDNGTTQAECRA